MMTFLDRGNSFFKLKSLKQLIETQREESVHAIFSFNTFCLANEAADK